MSDFYLLPHQISISAQVASSEIPDGVETIRAPEVWPTTRGEGVVIAVIDTGVDVTHPDLAGQIIGGRNFTADYGGDPNNYRDNNGHGTHVVGTIAAKDNGAGVVGVAPDAKLLILKVLDSAGGGSYAEIMQAIEYATNWRGASGEKVSIISMSLGGPTDFEFLHDTIKAAVAAGIIVICAAGNDGDGKADTDEYAYPAAYPEVVSVGAINALFEPAYFSNTNPEVDVVAPGVYIKSTYLNGQYANLSGTSMAAPHVAGAAALVKVQVERDLGRKLTEAELYAYLCKRTSPIKADPRLVGHGVINLTRYEKAADKPDPRTVDIRTAIEYLATVPTGFKYINENGQLVDYMVINSPDFWLELLQKFEADPEKYEDFRFVELLSKNFYVAKL